MRSLTSLEIAEIKHLYRRRKRTKRELCKAFSVSVAQINKIVDSPPKLVSENGATLKTVENKLVPIYAVYGSVEWTKVAHLWDEVKQETYCGMKPKHGGRYPFKSDGIPGGRYVCRNCDRIEKRSKITY